MRNMVEKARAIPKMKEFKSFMRGQQGLSDADFERPVEAIMEAIVDSEAESPLGVFEDAMTAARQNWTASEVPPVHSEWHHFIVPGAVLTALRNRGYEVDDEDIREGMRRGAMLPGGSCGFMGVCGGAYSVGIVASIVDGITPAHEDERSNLMSLAAHTLERIAKIPTRCCKRSSFIALQESAEYLADRGHALPVEDPVCSFFSQNPLCVGGQCPFHPRGPK